MLLAQYYEKADSWRVLSSNRPILNALKPDRFRTIHADSRPFLNEPWTTNYCDQLIHWVNRV